MDALSGYSSSPDCRARPPSPRDLESAERPAPAKRPRVVALPRVVGVEASRDAFLTHVRLPIAGEGAAEFVKARMGQARLRLVNEAVKAAFTEVEELHMSVSRPVVIREAEIGALVAGLRAEIAARCAPVVVEMQPEVVAFKGGKRVFVAAPVGGGGDGVLGIVRAVDKVFVKHGLLPFFKVPRLHVSFAWTEVEDVLPFFPEAHMFGAGERKPGFMEVTVDKVVCSVGKSNYHFRLKRN